MPLQYYNSGSLSEGGFGSPEPPSGSANESASGFEGRERFESKRSPSPSSNTRPQVIFFQFMLN